MDIFYLLEPTPHNIFEHAVNDDASYNDFGHQESSDGNVESGSFDVLLPNGHIQIVTYTVDDHSGYVADVKYDGAKYPGYNYFQTVLQQRPRPERPGAEWTIRSRMGGKIKLRKELSKAPISEI